MTDLHKYPPFERWHDWTELDAAAWPDQVERNYTLVPTTCFNCEAGCGLVAYFDRETGYRDKTTGKPVSELRQPEHGDVPGHDRGAEGINAPGPR